MTTAEEREPGQSDEGGGVREGGGARESFDSEQHFIHCDECNKTSSPSLLVEMGHKCQLPLLTLDTGPLQPLEHLRGHRGPVGAASAIGAPG